MYTSKIAMSSCRIVPCSLCNDLVTPNNFIVLKSTFSDIIKKSSFFFLVSVCMMC